MINILVVDDEEQMRTMLGEMLKREGYNVMSVPNGTLALEVHRKNPADLIIIDMIMPEKEGIDTIIELKKDFPEVNIFAMSGGGRNEPKQYLHMAKRLGADRTFTKPFTRSELLEAIKDFYPE